jgi:glucan phosphoethanolaminetransferase (alkaline phosphatase superfamily)
VTEQQRAAAEFKRMIFWIAVAGVIVTILALWYLSLYEPLRLHMVIATIAGVFFSMLLGCGLFAAAFYSEKSGHDQNVTDATRSHGQADREDP